MNITFILQLIAELNIMDISGIKPNYAALARKYDMDYRTVKKYHEGYKGKPKNRNKPSKLDEYEEVIIEKLSIPRTTMKAVHEFLIDQYGMDKIGSYSNFKIYCKKNKIKPKKRNPINQVELLVMKQILVIWLNVIGRKIFNLFLKMVKYL